MPDQIHFVGAVWIAIAISAVLTVIFLYCADLLPLARQVHPAAQSSSGPFGLRLRLQGILSAAPEDIQISENAAAVAICSSSLLIVTNPYRHAQYQWFTFEGDAKPLASVWISGLEIAVFLSCGLVVTMNLASVRAPYAAQTLYSRRRISLRS